MFISYAQNFEDVILWRALKHVENGFYVDVGAQDPIVDSVSRGFYEKGWRGVSVEPTVTYATKLRENRPDEEILQVAIGNGGEKIRFFEIPETGLSTGDAEIAQEHLQRGFEVVETEVPLLPLAEILDGVGDRDIHWLKIDVEGMEKSVLESWSPSGKKPWIVVAESTRPLQVETVYEDWEPLLISRGYEFVYFDGLNRFYISEEHMELKSFFGAGPNVFDDFAVSGGASSALAVILKERIRVCEERIETADERIAVYKERLQTADECSEAYKERIRILGKEVKEYTNRLAITEERIRIVTQEAEEYEKRNAALNLQFSTLQGERDSLVGRNESLLTDIQNISVALVRAQAQFNEQAHVMNNVRTELASVYASRSWKLTSPLRWMNSWVVWFIRGISAWLTLKPGSRPRRIIHLLITHAMLWVRRRPKIFAFALKTMHLFPPLERRAFASAHTRGLGLSYNVTGRGAHFQWQTDVEPEIYNKWKKLLK